MFLILLNAIASLLTYQLLGTALIISGDGIITPDEVNLQAVASITDVIVGEGITEIKSNSFTKCTKLKNISLPSTLIRMEGCFSSTQLAEIAIPANLKEITMNYMWTFTPLGKITVNSANKYFSVYKNCLLSYNQTFLYGFVNTADFEFPSTLTSIGTWAFAYKGALEFRIPDNVQYVSYQSFVDSSTCTLILSDKSKLEEIPERFIHQSVQGTFILPPKVTVIGKEGLYSSRISTFTFHPGSNLRTISEKAFFSCNRLTKLFLPKTVETISQSAFEGCTSLQEITIEAGSTKLIDNGICITGQSGKQLIWIHHNVSSFTIAKEIQVINSVIIQTCVNLSRIEIDPKNELFSTYSNAIYDKYYNNILAVIGGIETCQIHFNCSKIASSMFKGLPKLSSVSFPDNSICTTIFNFAFAQCSNLTQIKLADSISSISECAFQSSGLLLLTLPKKLAYFGPYQGPLTDLREIIFNENCPLTTINGNFFWDCTKLSRVVLSKNIKTISSKAFYNCNITSLEIPSSVTQIGDESFAKNYYLHNIAFISVSKISSILTGAFSNAAIESIILPKSLITLSNSAFANCVNLKSVTIEKESNLKELISQSFMGCIQLTTFTIPDSITKIDPLTFYKCIKLTKFEILNNQKFESIDGIIYEKSPRILVLFPPGKEIARIADKTVNIANNAFYGCSVLNSLNFGNSVVESIGVLTFFQCVKLSSVLIPKTVKNIYSRAFESCISMTSIEFADGSALLSIGASTFSGCGNLSSVRFPPGALLESIEDSTFANCVLLSDFTFPSNINSIGASAFSNCKSLRSVLLNSTKLRTIGKSAFKGCGILSEVQLPESLEEIGDMAFEGIKLQDLYVPTNVVSLGIGCFSNCKLLKNVYYCGNRQFESNIIFADSSNAIAFTLISYIYSSFCGLPTLKIMDRCGVFPTGPFTGEAKSCFSVGLHALIVLSEPGDEECDGLITRGSEVYTSNQRKAECS